MSEDQINELARAFADATGITIDVARTALEDQDVTMVRMAQGVVRLHETEDKWRADMAGWRRKILEAA
jgi:AraC-like DNA-binding protein